MRVHARRTRTMPMPQQQPRRLADAGQATAPFPLHALQLRPASMAPRRAPAAPAIDRAGGGATAFQDTLPNAPTRAGDVITGDVHRREFIPGIGGAPDIPISSGDAHVRFNAAACVVTLPYRFFFQQRPTARSPEFCED